MSNTVHPIALTTAYLMTTADKAGYSPEEVADLASRIHRCGMAIRRAVPKGDRKAMQRGQDWRASLNVSLEDLQCTLDCPCIGSMHLTHSGTGSKRNHPIC